MNRSFQLAWLMAALTGSVVVLLAPLARAADAPPPPVSMVGVQGEVSWSGADKVLRPAQSGAALPSGAVIRTGPKSAVDIRFGSLIGTLRLTENSSLVLDQVVNLEPGAEPALNVQLTLQRGNLLGNPSGLPATATFEIKVSNGVAAIVQGQFRLNAQGYLVLLNGAAGFVHVPESGEPVPYTLRAPPAVYFSPVSKIQAAPPELVREVAGQTKSKLRGAPVRPVVVEAEKTFGVRRGL